MGHLWVVSSCTGTQRKETLTNCVITPYMVMKTKGIPSCTGTPGQPPFMELIYERKLGLYFSLLISLVPKIFSEFQIKQIEEVIWKVFFFSKGTVTTSVLSACKLFGRCADDPSVLELLQKMFCKNKTGKQITVISHENRAKTEKKKATTIKKKKFIGSWIFV